MEYIILAAGVGTRLYPYTKNSPKCLVKVSRDETVIERAVRLISTYDVDAHITVVVGFCSKSIIGVLGDKCDYIYNPFYRITNSVASLWFAKDILEKNKYTVIINADIVFDDNLAKDVTSTPTESIAYYDSSIRTNGDYNIQILNGRIVAMGKNLNEYDGEYVGITKFTPQGISILLSEVKNMVNEELYDQWYENAMVQLSLTMKCGFGATDVRDCQWSEIDSIDNLLKIRKIINCEQKNDCIR